MNSHRLQISKRIFGRETEIAQLQEEYCNLRDSPPPANVFSKSSTHFVKLRSSCVFVKGLSGTGKSTLINESFSEIVQSENEGYFCQGKYDLLSTSERPFSALVDALSVLCSKSMENEGKGENHVQRLQDILRLDEVIALSTLMPNLAQYLHVRHDHDSSSSSIQTPTGTGEKRRNPQVMKHTFYRLKTVLKKLIQELVADKVLVLFIDDLQVSPFTLQRGPLQHLGNIFFFY